MGYASVCQPGYTVVTIAWNWDNRSRGRRRRSCQGPHDPGKRRGDALGMQSAMRFGTSSPKISQTYEMPATTIAMLIGCA